MPSNRCPDWRSWGEKKNKTIGLPFLSPFCHNFWLWSCFPVSVLRLGNKEGVQSFSDLCHDEKEGDCGGVDFPYLVPLVCQGLITLTLHVTPWAYRQRAIAHIPCELDMIKECRRRQRWNHSYKLSASVAYSSSFSILGFFFFNSNIWMLNNIIQPQFLLCRQWRWHFDTVERLLNWQTTYNALYNKKRNMCTSLSCNLTFKMGCACIVCSKFALDESEENRQFDH